MYIPYLCPAHAERALIYLSAQFPISFITPVYTLPRMPKGGAPPPVAKRKKKAPSNPAAPTPQHPRRLSFVEAVSVVVLESYEPPTYTKKECETEVAGWLSGMCRFARVHARARARTRAILSVYTLLTFSFFFPSIHSCQLVHTRDHLPSYRSIV